MDTWLKSFTAAAMLSVLSACQVSPTIRSQTEPQANFAACKTYGYFAKLGTDQNGHTSITSVYIEQAVDR